MPITVAIVEDNREIRDGLAFLIDTAPGFRCVAACPDGETAMAELPAKAPHVVLMDIELPGISGLDCVRQLKTRSPDTQIMMLTVFEDHDRIFRSLAAGANGYLVKKTPPDKLLEAIRELHEGGSPMSNQIARRVVEEFRKPTPAEAPTEGLTPREQEILNQLARGFLYKEIAATLGISIETVRTHIRNIYSKLHVRTRTEALLKVRPAGGR